MRLNNLLSFGPNAEEIELNPLNVLVGPNAAGKSNLIEALSLLQYAPSDLAIPLREGGGISEWLWKGSPDPKAAELDITAYYPQGPMPLRHVLSLAETGQKFQVEDERIENEHPSKSYEEDVLFYYRYQHGRPMISTWPVPDHDSPDTELRESNTSVDRARRSLRHLDTDSIDHANSILAQRKDADLYPEITYLGENYAKLKIYREWSLGPASPPRRPQQVDLPEDFLLEDATNIALILNNLIHVGYRSMILNYLQYFYEEIEDISTKIEGGTVQLYVHEKGLKGAPIPASRISDGMLRFLCLLSILCHPNPPPLVCIEEPELCLHPDIIPVIGNLLIEATERTQLIVTTHSDTLVSALSEVPQYVLVCERDEGGSTLKRLDQNQLTDWLEEFKLGDLWRMGEIGGTRW